MVGGKPMLITVAICLVTWFKLRTEKQNIRLLAFALALGLAAVTAYFSAYWFSFRIPIEAGYTITYMSPTSFPFSINGITDHDNLLYTHHLVLGWPTGPILFSTEIANYPDAQEWQRFTLGSIITVLNLLSAFLALLLSESAHHIWLQRHPTPPISKPAILRPLPKPTPPHQITNTKTLRRIKPILLVTGLLFLTAGSVVLLFTPRIPRGIVYADQFVIGNAAQPPEWYTIGGPYSSDDILIVDIQFNTNPSAGELEINFAVALGQAGRTTPFTLAHITPETSVQFTYNPNAFTILPFLVHGFQIQFVYSGSNQLTVDITIEEFYNVYANLGSLFLSISAIPLWSLVILTLILRRQNNMHKITRL
jgi:hypothetical protein